jgi:hypothetical protein
MVTTIMHSKRHHGEATKGCIRRAREGGATLTWPVFIGSEVAADVHVTWQILAVAPTATNLGTNPAYQSSVSSPLRPPDSHPLTRSLNPSKITIKIRSPKPLSPYPTSPHQEYDPREETCVNDGHDAPGYAVRGFFSEWDLWIQD